MSSPPCAIRLHGGNIVLRGGLASGRDIVHLTVLSWPGWRKAPPAPGADYGIYQAAQTPAAIFAAKACGVLAITWDQSAMDYLEKEQRRLAVVTESLREPLPSLPSAWPTSRTPMRHQLQALGALEALEWRAILADDMGLGKTSTALWAAWMAGATRLLVVCPVSVKWNWASEIEQTLGSQWRTIVIDGPAAARANLFADHITREAIDARQSICMNYDLLVGMGDHQVGLLCDFVEKGAFLILDESHYIKNVDAERTKIVTQKIVPHAKHLLLLSGTPMRNFACDLYPQVTAIRPGSWCGYPDFLDRHVERRLIPRGRRKVSIMVRNKRMSELNAVVSTMQVRRKKDDCIGMPDMMRTSPQLTMDPTMRQVYLAMKNHARYEIGAMVADHGPETLIWHPTVRTGVQNAIMRCEQVAQGFVGGVPDPLVEKLSKVVSARAEKIPGRPGELVFPLAAKMVWLIETIEAVRAQGGYPIVMSRFNGPMHWLKGKLAHLKVGFLHGALTSAGKHDVVHEFESGQTDVLLCQVRMAEGFHVTRSKDVIFFGRDWSPAVNAQAEARPVGIGQKGTVNVQIPIVRETVEVYLDKKLSMKHSDAESALAATTLVELLGAL